MAAFLPLVDKVTPAFFAEELLTEVFFFGRVSAFGAMALRATFLLLDFVVAISSPLQRISA
jgi:hypothetical protein